MKHNTTMHQIKADEKMCALLLSMDECPDDVCTMLLGHMEARSWLSMRSVSRRWRDLSQRKHAIQRAKLSISMELKRAPSTCVVHQCCKHPLTKIVLRTSTLARDDHRMFYYDFMPYCREHYHVYIDNLSFGDVMLSGSDGMEICVLCLR